MPANNSHRLIRTVLVGLGSVNRNLLDILASKKERLLNEYGLEFRVVCIADSSGVAMDSLGYDPATLRQEKAAGKRVSDMRGYNRSLRVTDVIEDQACDLVMEASPVNLEHGDPGLAITRAALSNGISVVLANKAPLVLAFHELHQLARDNDCKLGFSATVCGGLPVVNIGRRDLVAADIELLRGIFNSTCNFILDEMATGRSYEDALLEAQRRGIAEADPALDVEGWDTANKLSIIANSILGMSVTLEDIKVSGITALTQDFVMAEKEQGRRVKLVATAHEGKLSVGPVSLPDSDFLANCDGWEMGVEIHSDIYGKMYHKLWEREPIPTAASMLRDAVNILADKR
ncbi:MAG: hypothetical protein OEM03_03845 [Chromatiales bacterium]|nr:hypothetical protein [Chromatiales bacterium]